MGMRPWILMAALLCSAGAGAQSRLPAEGTLVVIKASGEVAQANDEVSLTLSVDEQNPNKNVALSTINQKMKKGVEAVRKLDPTAKLTTQDYRLFTVYREEKPDYTGARVVVGWRARQSLGVVTRDLGGLPKLVLGVKDLLEFDGLRFYLSAPVWKTLAEQRLAAAYRDLQQNIAMMAQVMGRKVADATIEEIEVDGAGGNGMQRVEVTGSRINRRDLDEIAEPSFEPGETTLRTQLIGKVRFK